MLKVSFHTLGCKVNQYETDAIMELFQQRGYEVVDFHESADICIINTCTVTNIADKKSRKMLSKGKSLNPSAIVVAMGCYAQMAENKLRDKEEIDLIIGNTKKNQVVDVVEDYIREHKKISLIEDMRHDVPYEEMWISKIEDKKRAHIKIQDGCNQFCSYCIIPFTRGRVRSRKPENVVKEVTQLVGKGYKEIVLTGIHLASYGLELPDYKLIDLLIELNDIKGLDRIRLGSLEPTLMTEDFIAKMAILKKICPHFHLSLQSGCDDILSRMNRHYDTKVYYESVLNLRKVYNKPAITTDIIVGFPGETDEEFQQTVEFVLKVGFADIHVFKYSPREGTKAAIMKQQIKEEMKNDRSKKLMTVRDELHDQYLKQFIGSIVEVIFEDTLEINGKEFYIGHASNYSKIIVDKTNDKLENRLLEVQIVEVINDFLKGEIE
ncbi:MAG: tRNA (N(6)-L-threonylcarbamoyladenosine(37)-C(2))-methylthiotransferase MtaB [Firmicutes bacterium HGW-Firmicutes-1]|jgi:threonylcarbamoyladenosine tRNA methylthiotransferase MtaB|nr:MAG: tRNA (N(6)-L-threonylcarbamoyladenosine(37)-C(2))-methylthiotransferase MtaB [Firmicutes bacterium HGW-Firmicutes-1]